MLSNFYPHDAMLVEVLAVAVCLSQVSVLSKGMDGVIWFWHVGFFQQVLHCVIRKIGHILK